MFVLTLKGAEELAARSYRLDVKLRNILFLIQKGSATFDTILQNSIFPREEVLERVRGLINDKFIALTPADGAAAAAAVPAAPASAAAAPPLPASAKRAAAAAPATLAAGITANGQWTVTRKPEDGFPMLDPGVSVSQARFVLCDFCLDEFGASGGEKADAINSAQGVTALQRVLDEIYEELRGAKRRDTLAKLSDRVLEINETKI
jgi:hypothetical protein